MTRVLHVLDHSLPLHSGYTFRTRAIMKAQESAGPRSALDLRPESQCRLRRRSRRDCGAACEQADGLVFHRTAGMPCPAVLVARERDPRFVARDRDALWQANGGPISSTPIRLRSMAAAAGLSRRALLAYRSSMKSARFWEDAAVGNRTGTRRLAQISRLTRASRNTCRKPRRCAVHDLRTACAMILIGTRHSLAGESASCPTGSI